MNSPTGSAHYALSQDSGLVGVPQGPPFRGGADPPHRIAPAPGRDHRRGQFDRALHRRHVWRHDLRVWSRACARSRLLNGNILTMAFLLTYGHLRHSNMWIAFTGIAGRILQSPAHHQLHHSANPAHFDKNLGFALALWDWAFGTLAIPAKTREPIVFRRRRRGGGRSAQPFPPLSRPARGLSATR